MFFFFKKDNFNINFNGNINYISVDDYLNKFNSQLIQALNENKSKKVLLCFVTKMRQGDKVKKNILIPISILITLGVTEQLY